MTREEAIAHGKEQLEVFGGEHREFIKMAIEALEQAHCEDAISRQSVLDALESIGSLDTEADREYARSIFEALPSVTS